MPTNGHLKGNALIEQVIHCPRLPTLPATAIAIIELCRREDPPVHDILEVIGRDPAVSLKVLRTANSGYFGLSCQVTTLSHALVLLGVNTIRILALSFSLLRVFGDPGGKVHDHSALWRRSLYSAMAAQTIAKQVNCSLHQEAFLGGLLQDIGVLALIQVLGSDYASKIELSRHDRLRQCAIERAHFGVDHTQIGERLAAQWNLPPLLIAAIRNHEQPEPDLATDRAFIYTVALGNLAAATFIRKNPRQAVPEYFEAAKRWLDLDPQTAIQILKTTGAAGPEMNRVFELPENDVDLNAILVEANEVMLELSLKAQRRLAELGAEPHALAAQTSKDVVTGTYGRDVFDRVFGERFQKALRDQDPLTLIMVNIDGLRQFNDTHGHQAGDMMLASVAAILMQSESPNIMVSRYSGEKFSIILPGADRHGGLTEAKRLHGAIAATEFSAGGRNPIHVTVSIGMAAAHSVRDFATPESMVQAADWALSMAIDGGGNRVCEYEVPKIPDDQTAA